MATPLAADNGHEALPVHPYYRLLPSYITQDSVTHERDEFLRRVRETLAILTQLKDGIEGVVLQKKHLRVVETLFSLKHALPKTLHRQLIDVLVWHLWETDATHVVDVQLEVRALQTLKLLLSKWTSKRPLSERCELVLSWRHAQLALERVLFSSPGQARLASPTTMMLLASGMLRCVEKARPFFASSDGSSVVAELWEEFAAKIKDTNSNQCFKALGYFALLFNIPANASEHEWQTIEKLVPQWLEAWASISRCEDWDGRWFKIFSRVAKRFPERTAVVLRDAMPFVFAKVHVLLEIPSDLGAPFKNNAWPSAFSAMRGTKRSDQLAMRLCAYLLGNPSEETGAPALANQYVVEILTTVKPFFHPSNASSAANALGIAVYYLGATIAKRLGAEKAAKKVLLRVESCRDVFDVLLQLSNYGIYSKNQSVATKCMYLLKSLLCVDPSYCARPVLDEMVKALDPHALSQSHMAPTAISSLSVFLYHLMCGQQAESTGLLFSTYLAPLLRLTLPGIDPNDEKKTMSTLTLYFYVLSWLPLVNDVAKTGGDKVLIRSETSDELFEDMKASLFTSITPLGPELDRKAWELGSFLEEWSLALLDRCFEFIRTRANSQTHDAASKSSNDDNHRGRGEDRAVLEVLNMMSLLYSQMSPAVYTQALRKTVNFVSNSFFTSAFGGKVISTLVFDCLQGNLEEAFAPFFQIVLEKLHNAKAESLMTNEKVWYLHILNGLVRFSDSNHSVLVKHSEELRAMLAKFLLHDDEKEVYEAAGNVLEHVLHALLGVYPLDFRSLPPREWAIANDESSGMFQFLGAAVSWKRLDIQWHEPNQDELAFARDLLDDHLLGTFKALELLQTTKDVTVRQWIPHLKRVFVSVRGARNIFVDPTTGQGALQAGSLPLLTRACAGKPELLDALVSLKSVVLTKTHAITGYWLENGLKGVTENQIWKIVLKVVKQLLVWRGSHLDGHRTKVKQNTYIKTTTADVASREFRRGQRFELDPLSEVPLSSRNEMTERVLFFYSKRKVQEHYETAHHVLSHGDESSSPTRAQYEALLLDVETLMKHPYEEVRGNASGVLRESAEIFTKWVHSRISAQLEVLEGKVTDAQGQVKEEVISGALEFLRRPIVWSHLWKTRGSLLLRALKAVLSGNETIVKKLDTESSKAKVGLKIQEFFLAVLGSWRYVREQPSTAFINELILAEPAQTEHWKQQLMHLVCFFPLLQPQEAPLPLRLWELVIKRVRHDVLPVRQVAILLLSQLVKLLKNDKASGSANDEAYALLFSDATLTTIVDAFVDNHRNTNQFAASADGQHANSAPSDWSFGVSEAIRYLSTTSTGHPRPPPLSSIRLLNQTSDSFKTLELAHLKLVQRLTQMQPSAIVRGPVFGALEKLTGSIDVKVSDEDRQASLATLGEWVGGVLRGALKLPVSDNEVAATAVVSVTEIIKKVMPHVNLTLVDPWAQVLYFAARPSQNHPTSFQLDRLEGVVSYVLNELDQAFARATVEDYANQVKWLSLVEPFLVLVLGWVGAGSERFSGLRANIRDTVVRIIDTHALAHRYKMVRDRAAKTLYILDVNDHELAPDSRPTKALLEKLSALTRVESLLNKDDDAVDQEEESEALSAKETAMQWLVCADRLGDTRDFLRVMKPLFPVAFLTQNHSKVEIALLAKNATNAISLSLRLHAPPTNGSSEYAPVNDLLAMLEQFASHQRWKTRAAVLRFLTSFTFYHWIFLSAAQQQRVQRLVMSFLADEQREVQDMAKYALRSLVHIQRPTVVDALSLQLTEQAQDARVKHPKLVRRLQKQEKEQVDSADEIAKTKSRIKTNDNKMATSVLGMSAIVLAFPYSVPAFVPPLFEELGRYLYIKQSTAMVSYLEKAVKDTLLEFKRTHQDQWLEIKNNFTQAQRDVFEDVLISPSYYT